MISNKRRPQLKNFFQSPSTTASTNTSHKKLATENAQHKITGPIMDPMMASYDDVYGFSEEEDHEDARNKVKNGDQKTKHDGKQTDQKNNRLIRSDQMAPGGLQSDQKCPKNGDQRDREKWSTPIDQIQKIGHVKAIKDKIGQNRSIKKPSHNANQGDQSTHSSHRQSDQDLQIPKISRLISQIDNHNPKSSTNGIIVHPSQSISSPKTKLISDQKCKSKPLNSDGSISDQTRRLVAVNTPKAPSNFHIGVPKSKPPPAITAPKPKLIMSSSFSAGTDQDFGEKSKVIDTDIDQEQFASIQGRVKQMRQVFATLPNAPLRSRPPIPIGKDYNGDQMSRSIDRGDQGRHKSDQSDQSDRWRTKWSESRDQSGEYKDSQNSNAIDQACDQSDKIEQPIDKSDDQPNQVISSTKNRSQDDQPNPDQIDHRLATKPIPILLSSLSDELSNFRKSKLSILPLSKSTSQIQAPIQSILIDQPKLISLIDTDSSKKISGTAESEILTPSAQPRRASKNSQNGLTVILEHDKISDKSMSSVVSCHGEIEDGKNGGQTANIKWGMETTPLNDFVWFHGDIDRKISEAKLAQFGMSGAFLIRYKSTPSDDSPYSLSVLQNGKIYHLQIRRKSNGAYALGDCKPNELEFNHLHEIVSYHRRNPLQLIRRKSGELAGLALLTTAPPK